MIAVISGTNRPGAKTLGVAKIVGGILHEVGEEPQLLDLTQLPHDLFRPEAYTAKPPEFAKFQQMILDAHGILIVVPEYNGSYPGVLKYFIDMLRFPESLVDKPAGFVGLSAGRWGGIRSVEQLKMVMQYRHVHLYGRACYLPGIDGLLDDDGRVTDPEVEDRLRKTVIGFADFCRSLNPEKS